MPMPAKNLPLSPAATDLGLDLQQEVRDEEIRKKKKLSQQAQAMASASMSPAAQALYPGGYSGGYSV